MVLKFHAETPIVRGYNRSCIYDLPRGEYNFIANSIIDKLQAFENYDQAQIELALDSNEKKWLEYLIEKEYCFFIPKNFSDFFPKIDFQWKSPSIITNTIIDVDASQIEQNINLNLNLLENINCKHLVIRFFNCSDYNKILGFLKININNLTFQSIEIEIEKNINFLNKDFTSIKKIIKNEIEQVTDVRTKIDAKIIAPFFRPNFIIDISVFSEALKYNTFFNRKLYIDTNRNIKNSIETSDSASKIDFDENKIKFENKILKPTFRKLWNRNKDQTDVCKNCEFRYMCIDNRIPKVRKKGNYYFDFECSYNPFISKWKNDDDYYSLSEIGVLTNKSVFYIDHNQVKIINDRIWSDV